MRAEAIRRRDLAGPSMGWDEVDEEEEPPEADAAGGGKLEYRVAATGACVTLSNAKSLLFYFCSKLPSDRHVCVHGSSHSLASRVEDTGRTWQQVETG